MFPGGRAGCESRSQAAAVTARASHGARPPAAPQRAAPPGARQSLSLRAEPSRGGGAESGGRGGRGRGVSCSLSRAPGSSRLSPTAHSSGGMGRRLGRPGAMARASLPFLLLLAALCSRGQQPQPPPSQRGTGERGEWREREPRSDSSPCLARGPRGGGRPWQRGEGRVAPSLGDRRALLAGTWSGRGELIGEP